ncbi:MAG: class I SAM-dependent methyltransferase [Candidatus Omnitrophota bacterium]
MKEDNKKRLEVKRANRSLYNKIKGDYEKIDGRRSEELFSWLRDRLSVLSGSLPQASALLDIGCGSGFVIRAARGLFAAIYGIDISEGILRSMDAGADGLICADADSIPLKDGSVDMVILFSTMHHLYDARSVLKEITRVLRKGGVLYIDHDMEKGFVRRFSLLVRLYRLFSRKEEKYINAGIKRETYELSEFRSEGIDKKELEESIKGAGLDIIESYVHWFGLSSITNRIFGRRKYPLSFAPLLNVVARKD